MRPCSFATYIHVHACTFDLPLVFPPETSQGRLGTHTETNQHRHTDTLSPSLSPLSLSFSLSQRTGQEDLSDVRPKITRLNDLLKGLVDCHVSVQDTFH